MYVVSIMIEKRKKTVPKVQEVLTKYGDGIHSRLGVHTIELEKEYIIILYTGEHIEEFAEELKENENVIVNYMDAN